MGKKATYAIGFARSSPFAQEIKQHRKELHVLKEKGKANDPAAARVRLEIADLLIDECDQIDPDPTDPDPSFQDEDDEITQKLKSALEQCEKAYHVFSASPEAHQVDDLARTYDLMVQCYQRLDNYELAIEKCQSLVTLLRRQTTHDMGRLQAAFKALGDIFYKRGHDPDGARHDDFENARHYYLKERAILENLTSADFDNDSTVLPDLFRSSNFNLGVIESKIPGRDQKAEAYLVTALKEAKTLRDLGSEKKTWWELGNVFKRQGKGDRVLQCQQKELDLIRQHGFKDDEIPCLVELIKTHLEREDYAQCLELCREMRTLTEDEDDVVITSTVEMVVNMQAKKREIAQLPLENADVTTRAGLWLDLGRLQLDADMPQQALVSVVYGLQGIEGVAGVSMSEELHSMRIHLFQLRLDAQWQQRNLSLLQYVDNNHQALVNIKTYIFSMRERLEQSQLVYERMVRIHVYFSRPLEAERWRKVAQEAEREFDQLEEDDFSEQMDLDSRLFLKDSLLGNHTAVFNPLPERMQPSKITVCVSVPLGERDEVMLIPCRSDQATIEWLMNEAARRTWESYGVAPRISNLRRDNIDLFPKDFVLDVIKDERQRVVATVSGFEEKSIVERYENICTRLRVPLARRVKAALETQAQQDQSLSLEGAGLSLVHIPVLKELFKHLPFLTHLNISANMLHDEDVESVLTMHPTLTHLDLRSNLLTAKTLETIYKTCATRVVSIRMAYNVLGPSGLECLPEIFLCCSKLKLIDLESCELGEKTVLRQAVVRSFGMCHTESFVRDVVVRLNNNAFEDDMLLQWTPLLAQLSGMETLEMSDVTTESRWTNIHLLAKIPNLRSVSLSHIPHSLFEITDVRDMLQMSLDITRLDLSYCDLNGEDFRIFCQALTVCNTLKELSLEGNQRLGDEGVTLLRRAFDLNDSLLLTTLNLSGCGLTGASVEALHDWLFKMETLHVKHNPRLYTDVRTLTLLVRAVENSVVVDQQVHVTCNETLRQALQEADSHQVHLDFDPSLSLTLVVSKKGTMQDPVHPR